MIIVLGLGEELKAKAPPPNLVSYKVKIIIDKG